MQAWICVYGISHSLWFGILYWIKFRLSSWWIHIESSEYNIEKKISSHNQIRKLLHLPVFQRKCSIWTTLLHRVLMRPSTFLHNPVVTSDNSAIPDHMQAERNLIVICHKRDVVIGRWNPMPGFFSVMHWCSYCFWPSLSWCTNLIFSTGTKFDSSLQHYKDFTGLRWRFALNSIIKIETHSCCFIFILNCWVSLYSVCRRFTTWKILLI